MEVGAFLKREKVAENGFSVYDIQGANFKKVGVFFDGNELKFEVYLEFRRMSWDTYLLP